MNSSVFCSLELSSSSSSARVDDLTDDHVDSPDPGKSIYFTCHTVSISLTTHVDRAYHDIGSLGTAELNLGSPSPLAQPPITFVHQSHVFATPPTDPAPEAPTVAPKKLKSAPRVGVSFVIKRKSTASETASVSSTRSKGKRSKKEKEDPVKPDKGPFFFHTDITWDQLLIFIEIGRAHV